MGVGGSWHILLPAFTVGVASYIALLEGLAFVTSRSVYALGWFAWPNMVILLPGPLTSGLAAPEATQAFLWVGTLVLLPTVLFYTGWSYWVFRGKVRPGGGYHLG